MACRSEAVIVMKFATLAINVLAVIISLYANARNRRTLRRLDAIQARRRGPSRP